MENDENTLDTQEVEQESEPAEVEETEAEGETAETQSEPAVEPPKKLTYAEKLAQAKTPEEKFAIADAEANKNRRLLGKKPTASQPKAPQRSSPSDVEEAVLLAQGMPEELLTSLKKVSQLEGIGSLIKAQANPLFVAMKEKFEREAKQKASSMPASRGSGQARSQKDVSSPGLSKEEHRKLALEAMNS